MEKMIWTRPVAEVEQFMPNEYIAKCNDFEKKYYAFKCDAGRYNSYNTVYYETTGNDKLDISLFGGGDYRRTETFHPCDVEHYTEVGKTNFIDGYIVTGVNWDGVSYDKVVIWEGPGNDNVHCSYGLKEDIQIITGNKS